MGKERRDYWSDCGQVFFLDGFGWGLTPELERIPLGREEDIAKFFQTGELNHNLKPIQKQVLRQIQEFRETGAYGTGEERVDDGTNIGTTDMERAGNNGASRRKPKAVRLLTARKRLPLRPSRTKGKSLSGK